MSAVTSQVCMFPIWYFGGGYLPYRQFSIFGAVCDLHSDATRPALPQGIPEGISRQLAGRSRRQPNLWKKH